MKLGKIIFSVILLFGFKIAFSQAPGYMGKRTVAGYGFYFSPVIYGASANNKTLLGNEGSAEKKSYVLNVTHELFIEHTLKSRLAIGLALKYFRTGYDNQLAIKDFGKPTDYYTINSFGVAVYSKYFFKRYVAPWGKYFTSGITVNASRSVNNKYMYVSSKVKDHDTLLFDFGPAMQTNINVDVLLGFGKTRIFSNKYSVEYGFNTQLLALFSYIAEPDNAPVSKENYISVTTKERLRGFNRFNFFIKLGYLF